MMFCLSCCRPLQPPGAPPQPDGSAGAQLSASVLGSVLVAVAAAWIQLFASSGERGSLVPNFQAFDHCGYLCRQ